MGLQTDMLLSRVVRQVKGLFWWPYSGLHSLRNMTTQRNRKALCAILFTTKAYTQDPCALLCPDDCLAVGHQNPSHIAPLRLDQRSKFECLPLQQFRQRAGYFHLVKKKKPRESSSLERFSVNRMLLSLSVAD